jgi:hypothetical protein
MQTAAKQHPKESVLVPAVIRFRTRNAIRTAEESPRLWQPLPEIAIPYRDESSTNELRPPHPNKPSCSQ